MNLKLDYISTYVKNSNGNMMETTWNYGKSTEIVKCELSTNLK